MNRMLLFTVLVFVGSAVMAAVPRITYPDAALIELYGEAWREAKIRTLDAPEGTPVKRYMDENVYADQIWIWDSCFMAQFTKYVAADYPGIETLEALYVPVVEGKTSPLRVHIYDNPPLFAWCELVHWRFHGDRARLKDILLKRRLLQLHYDWFAAPPTGTRPSSSPNRIVLKAVTAGNGAKGFLWSGGMSGMDNTPRGRGCGGYSGILWVDAISQQALSAKSIARLYADLGDTAEAIRWQARYDALAKEINDHYWDERDGLYYDIALKDGASCRVKTIASFWPLFVGIATPERAIRAIEHLRNPAEFGGERPLPTVSRDDPDFDAKTGNYWRGAIWLPTAYMAIKALENYGERALADLYARRIIEMQARVFRDIEPHTIWECYASEHDAPSTEHGRRVRPCFCGWSALGPVNLFIENVLGLRDVDAAIRMLVWEPPQDAKFPMGIENLTFGDTTVSLWTDGKDLKVSTDRPVAVCYQGRRFDVQPGTHTLCLR